MLSVILACCMAISLAACSKSKDSSEETSQEASQQQASEVQLSDLKVHFIEVGQADAFFVELPDHKSMLIDAGDAEHVQKVLETIKQTKVSKIDYVIATHPHADHIGGMTAVFDEYEVGRIYLPNATHTTDTYAQFLETIQKKDISMHRAVKGKTITGENKSYTIEILGPDQDFASEDLNEYSAVVKITYKDTTFLFAGDASAEQILKASPGHVDLLKVSHHGSDTGTNEALLAHITPRFAVMSYGTDNTYGHPTQHVLDLLSAQGIAAYATAIHGHITATSNGVDITIATEREGTIVAGVVPQPEPEPAPAPAPAPAQSQASAGNQGASSQKSAPQKNNSGSGGSSKKGGSSGGAPQGHTQTVIVTKSGKAFHRSGCPTIKRSSQTSTMSRDQAVASGYSPCKVCKP